MDKLASKLAKGYFTLKDLGVKLADIRRLIDKGYRVNSRKVGGQVFYSILTANENISLFLSGLSPKEQEFKWVELSDIHAGSRQFDEVGLRDILKRAVDRGYRKVFISGDLTDGYGVYRSHLSNLRLWRMEDQAALLAEILGDYDLEYYAIMGNHDASFLKDGGLSPLVLIQNELPHFTYLPSMAADIIIGGVVKRMVHLDGGGAYSISYPGQKYIRNVLHASGQHIYIHGKKYRIRFLQLGHLHFLASYESGGIQVTHPGNYQFPNDFTLRKGLVGPQGSIFVTTTIQQGHVLSYTPSEEKPRRDWK